MVFSRLNRLFLFLFMVSSMFFLAGCGNNQVDPEDLRNTGNNTLIIPDLIRHFEKCKVPIKTVQLIRPDVAHADDAVSIRVDGKEIGIYKYNVNIRKQRENLARIMSENYLYLVGFKKDVIVNRAFVMVGANENPKKELLEKSFMSFK